MDIKEQAVRKAVNLLAAAGAEYAIVALGKTYASGNLEVKRRVKRSPVFDHVEKYNYQERIDAVDPNGGVVTCIAASKEEAISLRGAMGSYVQRNHGQGACITSVDKKEDGWHVSLMLMVQAVAA